MKRWALMIGVALMCSVGVALAADLDAEAVFQRADALYQRQQFSAAAPLLQQAADMGHAGALARLAGMYDSGRGVGRDPRKALQLYEAAALQGNVQAQFALAIQYEVAKGVPRDHDKALHWLRQAAGNGDAQAASYLAVLERADTPVFKSEQALAAYVQSHRAAPR